MASSVLLSDAIGILASLVLVIPGAKDNLYRFREARQKKKASRDKTPFRKYVVEAWRRKRDAFSAVDSLFMIIGGLGLAASFVLKTQGM